MIGVIVLTYQSSDVIEACLDSLSIARAPALRVVVCDNASQDDTVAVVRAWAASHGVALSEPGAGASGDDAAALTLLKNGRNLGFAGGVNIGLAHLMDDPRVDLFWILNPDGEAGPGAAAAYMRCAANAGPFSLMGGRIRFKEAPGYIQSDGGRVSRWSGICRNVNAGRLPQAATPPDARTLDFISGANMVASRAFIERVGPMVEDYFLYYEEVDWAARRGDLPLCLCPEAEVIHVGGTTIGTGSVTRRPSPFANFFNYRNRMRFMRRIHPWALPSAWALSMGRIAKLVLIGAFDEAWAAFSGLNGLPPPAGVRERIAPADRCLAFGVRERCQ